MKTYKVTVDDHGNIKWYNEQGQLHNEHGPAIEYADGSKCWYLNSKCHRENGPAYENVNGAKSWYRNGKLHREDGPACEWANGYKEWYLNGKYLTEAEFNARTKKQSTCDGKVVEIDGKKYKLTEL